MTIKVNIIHENVQKLDSGAKQETLFVQVGHELHELRPGQGGTFYVHRAQDIRVFYDRRAILNGSYADRRRRE